MNNNLYSILKKVFKVNDLNLEHLQCKKLPLNEKPIKDCLNMIFSKYDVNYFQNNRYKDLILDSFIFIATVDNIQYSFIVHGENIRSTLSLTYELSNENDITEQLINAYNYVKKASNERCNLCIHKCYSPYYVNDILLLDTYEDFYTKAVEYDLRNNK